jgi:hypothetical protein
MKPTTRAFILGLYEFRRMFTTSFDTHAEYAAYDKGRDLAHKLTLRYWDD